MSATSNILSGSHFEIQFSEIYIQLLFNKALYAGLIPSEFEQDSTKVEIQKLYELKFINETDANVEFNFDAVITYATLPLNAKIGARIFIEFKGTRITFKYSSMTDETVELLKGFGLSDTDIRNLSKEMQKEVKGEYDFSSMIKNAATFKSRIIFPDNPNLLPCLNLMINVNGIESVDINPANAKSFLGKDHEYALGLSADRIPAFVAPIKKKMQEWVDDNFTDDYVRSCNITPLDSGKIKIDMYIKGIWEGIDELDPDIDVDTTMSLEIVNGKINLKADDTDIEIGNWFTDVVVGVIGTIVGGVAGFLVGSIFGGPFIGAAIGGSLVGSFGLFGLHETILEEYANDQAGQFLQTLYAIPYNMKIADGVFVDHHFSAKIIDSKGIALAGIQKRELKAVKKFEDGTLEAITLEDQVLDPAVALSKVSVNHLKISDLKIIAVNKSKTRIANLKFNNNVIMSVDETIKWQLRGLWNVAGVKLIQPKSGNTYYRTVAGDDRNLDNYPTFKMD